MTKAKTSDLITIVTVTDKHYLVLLAALIKSIEANHTSPEAIDIHVVANGVPRNDRSKLDDSISQSSIRIIWHEMNNVVPKSIKVPKDKSSYPSNIYVRLFFPWFIDQKVTRVLYLDCDMIVLEDISKLFHSDLMDFPLGAVIDPKIRTFNNNWGGITNYKQLGLRGESFYFNSGLLLIDCIKWRELDLTQKVIDCATSNRSYLNYPDQYGLNVVLADNWMQLDSRWNSFSVIETTSRPFLIHFTERKPIYRSYSDNQSYKQEFLYYLKQTSWSSFKPISEISRLAKKAFNILSKYKIR